MKKLPDSGPGKDSLQKEGTLGRPGGLMHPSILASLGPLPWALYHLYPAKWFCAKQDTMGRKGRWRYLGSEGMLLSPCGADTMPGTFHLP